MGTSWTGSKPVMIHGKLSQSPLWIVAHATMLQTLTPTRDGMWIMDLSSTNQCIFYDNSNVKQRSSAGVHSQVIGFLLILPVLPQGLPKVDVSVFRPMYSRTQIYVWCPGAVVIWTTLTCHTLLLTNLPLVAGVSLG